MLPSDVIPYLLTEGVESAIAAFPILKQHRAVAQQIFATSEELTALELKVKEAQSRLDATDRELCLLLSSQTSDSQGETKKCLLGQEVEA
jgi:hypothetical protein